MKKCVFLMCALFLGAGVLAGSGKGIHAARADAPRTDFSALHKPLKIVDFEQFEVGTTDVYGPTRFWSDGSIEVVESNGSKAIQFKNVGGTIGGIRGDIAGEGDTDLFENGKKYRIEFDSIIGSEEGGVQIDFHETDYWTSVVIKKDSAVRNPSGSTTLRNVVWNNGHVSFDIECNAGNHYFTIYNSGLAENETFIVDNFVVYSLDLMPYHNDFVAD